MFVWQYHSQVELWKKWKKSLEDDTLVYKQQINAKKLHDGFPDS